MATAGKSHQVLGPKPDGFIRSTMATSGVLEGYLAYLYIIGNKGVDTLASYPYEEPALLSNCRLQGVQQRSDHVENCEHPKRK